MNGQLQTLKRLRELGSAMAVELCVTPLRRNGHLDVLEWAYAVVVVRVDGFTAVRTLPVNGHS